MPSKIIPQEHKDAMVKSYLDGKTAKQSAEPFGYSWMACISELKRRGIATRTNSQTHRKYKVNETFFDNIDTEEKAYWLGFLTADGNIKKTAIQLHISSKDREHLLKFIKALRSEHPVYDRIATTKGKKHKVCGVNIGSAKLSDAVQKLGVKPRKSFVVKPCMLLPPDLVRHYWRGVVDGDGCLSRSRSRKTGNGSPKWSINLVGSRFITKAFSDWVRGFTKTKAKIRRRGRVWNIGYSGNGIATAVIKTLYEDATVYMTRKMERAANVMKLAAA